LATGENGDEEEEEEDEMTKINMRTTTSNGKPSPARSVERSSVRGSSLLFKTASMAMSKISHCIAIQLCSNWFY